MEMSNYSVIKQFNNLKGIKGLPKTGPTQLFALKGPKETK